MHIKYRNSICYQVTIVEATQKTLNPSLWSQQKQENIHHPQIVFLGPESNNNIVL
ncbi:uncharacterized protein ASCRUDRAFT_74779 [Ascoidea rubescens DSM 1968]|uniref:Uncharacterized protein n=1 Tax=Ascoidea rubescens DSM 1968 TaxID=1344418 RepID=A0A1D2VLA6_9ASCO|nr:hypothetical protein ASCRUDRAFT_74779 [Ascoidea rubescens DSM 1968]ODV62392.1 hypothetical protein ASCRUDRAFT_74779 [Ascoidea rubescens DSM 1968]